MEYLQSYKKLQLVLQNLVMFSCDKFHVIYFFFNPKQQLYKNKMLKNIKLQKQNGFNLFSFIHSFVLISFVLEKIMQKYLQKNK